MTQSPPTTQTTDLDALLRRFGEALAVVCESLRPLAAEAAQAATSGQGEETSAASSGLLPRAAELADLLAHNDTRAEGVLAEIRSSWTGTEPSWLAAASRAIDTLDYDGALALLRRAGALPG